MPLHFQFCSGLGRVADFLGVTGARMAPGIQVNELHGRLTDAVLAHLRHGGTLLVDSGAYPAYMAGRDDVDFDAVLSAYESLSIAAAAPGALYLVAPDQIGNPVQTLKLLRASASRLRALSRRGVSLIAPVQIGGGTLSNTWTAVKRALRGVRVIPGMPMRAASATIDQVVAFLRETAESRVHLLGTSRLEYVRQIDEACPGVAITADANRIRSAVGRKRRLTRQYNHEVDDVCATEYVRGGALEGESTDWIYEALNTPGFLTPSEVEVLLAAARHSGHDLQALRRAIWNGTLAAHLTDDFLSVLCDYTLAAIYRRRVARHVGPTIRQRILTAHFAEEVRERPQVGAVFASGQLLLI